ncbi:tetratricopeptide (TPR) repeat protein/DNA-binding CsgD family transcriptional regulator [Saonia flava]|uniref:Tetratricopeptide (TPR) repeat protein/DNA-binding CsgD family transcriptional regulator n=1 Tax=Saonia flava TaxID=523696 RepID=A0A846QM18_9FLAO|nr:tetratricopeptide repeat protein [Saonia flava]NJB70016.1 tetratricopeptide (TPR) repeat protein/DNA-binding CsgD family transcriptional regulator [Saonia flava]
MKKLLYLTLLLSVSIFAQDQKKIDSLLALFAKTKIDSIKLKTANGIASYYMYRDIKEAKKYSEIELKIASDLNDNTGKLKAHNHYATIYTTLSKYDSAQYHIEASIRLAKENDKSKSLASAVHSLVILEITRGNYKKADSLNQLNLKFNEKIKDSFGLALSYDTACSIYIDKDYNQLALENALKSLEIFQDLSEEIRVADAFYKIAIIENSLENFNASIENSQKALKVYREHDDVEYQSSILNILGISHKFKKKYDKAIDYFNESLKISNEHGYKTIKLVSIPHLIDIYLETGDNEKAKALIDQGLSIARSIHSDYTISYINVRLATYYKNIGDFNKAIALLNRLQKDPLINEQYLGQVHRLKSEVFKSNSNYQKALESYESFKKHQDSTLKRKNISKINELRIIHQNEQNEIKIALQGEEINTLNEKAKVDKLTKGLYAGGMASALALFGLSVFGFRQRIKKNRIAREKQEEIYKQEIDHKKKELTSQTLHLVQKNTFIQELMENLESIKKSPELFKTEFRRIVMLLKKENASDKDWEVFKTYFSEVHNDFDQKLKTLSSDISEKEIRLAAFIRMNLTTKEIAATLNVLPDSILKSKYRLKKKLGLDKETDLSTFLNTL